MEEASINRKILLALFGCYSVAVAVSCVFPLGLNDTEWYSFYAYLDKHGTLPYVDIREGYPPLGFLIYMPLHHVFREDVTAFVYGFRVLNGTFLVATLFTFYLIIEALHDEKRALQLSLGYAVLPSVLVANAYSNDVVALLPAALAIYYMIVKQRALSCGVLLGLATLGKGFPALLVIPAFFAFTDIKDRVRLVGSMVLVLVFASLPFMLANPLTYLSTFKHVGSRGPWETVWAIGDGYYSHGGLLHPFFDKLFYHFNLLNVYPASHYDHAVYAWNLEQLPNLLTFLQVAAVVVISLVYFGRKKEVVPLCGLLYIGYMLFFKGYSTQFAVSTPFYVLLATASSAPLLFLIPLEVSHVMQILAWNAQAFAPEFLRNEHLPMLVASVVLRSFVFVVLIVSGLRGSNFSFKPLMGSGRRLVSCLGLLKDKVLVSVMFVVIVLGLFFAVPLYGYMNGDSGFRSFKGTVSVAQSEWRSIAIDGLEDGDQVIVRLASSMWFEAELANSTVQVERGVRNPYSLKGSFNESLLFFRADSEVCSLMLRMGHPRMPFRVVEGFEKDLGVNVSVAESGLMFGLCDGGLDGNASRFTLAYPISMRVGDDFVVRVRYSVFEGNRSNFWVYVFDDTDEWLYPFAGSEDFVLTAETEDLYGYANLWGDDVSLVELSVLLEDNESAVFRLDEFSVRGGEDCDVELYAFPEEEVSYEVFIERDFEPSAVYAASLLAAVTLGGGMIWRVYRIVKRTENVKSGGATDT